MCFVIVLLSVYGSLILEWYVRQITAEILHLWRK